MKTKFLLGILTVCLFAAVQRAPAQYIGQPMGGVYGGGGQVYEPGTFQPVASEIWSGRPGRFWVEGNLADAGLGYQGSYVTLGAKTRLCEDFFDGRWLVEARAHQSLNNGGGFFGNLGLERVISINAAGAELGVSVWADYDSDLQGDFAHAFGQLGATVQVKTRKADLVVNGYFPQGTTNYALGDPTGVNCFFGNNIIVLPGIDSALDGFDITSRVKPPQLAFANGTFEIGGYGYKSDLVNYFGGGRVGVGFQALNGLIVNTQVNYDDRFGTTGVISMGWIFGANARGNEYSGVGRDLEPTYRNDHIVRFQQDVVYAIDPDTGAPYNVWFVDNTADPAFADGSFETRFVSLAQAEAASAAHDIIFVFEGDSTARNMRDGITLRNHQLLLGDGVQHIIPIQNGLNFVLCNDIDGNLPTISGSNFGNAVTLANNNVVAGFNIDGSAGDGFMATGIFGNRGSTIIGGEIRDNIISNAVNHGVYLEDIGGNWDFARNNINNNGFDGIRILDACDPNSVFLFDSNNVSFNGRDGISIENYDARALTFLNNITNDNLRHGVFLQNFKNSLGNGLALDFRNHRATGNNGFGINIIGGDGNLRLLNGNITNNVGGGLNIVDWTNTNPNHLTLITTTGTGTSNYSNNQPGVGINVELNGGTQRLIINNTTLNNNNTGFRGSASGVGTLLISRIQDNISVNNNLSDGLRIIAVNGATHNTAINQPSGGVFGTLNITNNNGSGISFFTGDNSGNVSLIEAVVANVNLTGNAAGIFSDVFGDGALRLNVSNSNIDLNGVGMSFFVDTNDTNVVNTIGISNITMLDNGTDAISLQVQPDSLVDFSLVDSVLESTAAIAADGDTNTLRIGGFGSALDINVVGDPMGMAGPTTDTRVRLFVQGNRMDEFAFDGISIDTFGDAHVLARIEGNELNQNGFGLGTAGDGTGSPAIVAPMFPPVFDGIGLTSFDESRIDLRLTGNDITASSERGVDVLALDTSTINMVWLDNDFSDNDTANDPSNDPIREDNISDFDVVNGLAGSTICLSMSNNFWNNGFAIVNFGATPDFTLELDGFTNLFDAASPGVFNVTEAAFGSTCDGLIDAAETAFRGDGFPDIP